MSVTIRDLMTDPALFGAQFAGESWANWRALLASFYGLDLTDDEHTNYLSLTGRSSLPPGAFDELWLVVGRRGGKTQAAALLAVFEAFFRDHSDKLSPGEVATVMLLAADRKQARSVFRYISGLIDSNPMLRAMVVREDKESIELSNRTAIEVHTASFRATRGYTVSFCCADELAFWRAEDSANPDHEILNAIRPAMATLEGKLVALSSPYSKRGALWDAYRRYYATDDVHSLVAQASSKTMNPSLPQRVIDQAYDRDPESAKAEYGAQFRSDLEAFIDPAGGGQDEYTLAIGHREDTCMVVDLIRAKRGVPAEITAEYAAILKAYSVHKAHSDKYAGSWPADEFKKHGITIEYSPKPRSELYLDALPAITSGRVELPPIDKLLAQFVGLERKTSRTGRDSVNHSPGAHDDIANAAAGLIALNAQAPNRTDWRALL
ncbi:terminase large subunit [Pseudomonas sp.]|uniref:terminase large subunit domain-containing protein n=1 Tax=Pseudomonas sp. TaxID=306 RepID=UPI0032630EDC